MTRALPRPDWHTYAACHGLTDLFYPDRGRDDGTSAEAAAVCATCPVQTQCRAAARHERHGVWAGESYTQRRRRVRVTRQTRDRLFNELRTA